MSNETKYVRNIKLVNLNTVHLLFFLSHSKLIFTYHCVMIRFYAELLFLFGKYQNKCNTCNKFTILLPLNRAPDIRQSDLKVDVGDHCSATWCIVIF